MSENTLIMGLKWGAEGNDKIDDKLSESTEAVCRCQGGQNAGHTITVNGDKTVSELILKIKCKNNSSYKAKSRGRL